VAASPIDRSLRLAKRRLIQQLLLNKVVVALSFTLVAALVWFVVQPFAFPALSEKLRWWVLGGCGVAGIIAGCIAAFRAAPSQVNVALAIDQRFELRERITTAVALSPELRESSAGQALWADATAKVSEVRVKDRFPVRPKRSSLAVPVLAACAIAACLWWNPEALGVTGDSDSSKPGTKTGDQATLTNVVKKKAPAKPPAVNTPEREKKSKELKELEEELAKLQEKYAKDPHEETPEKQREKAAELVALEEKAKKLAEQQLQKLQQLEQKFAQLEKLKKDPDFNDGPAKELNDALSKGDIKKAEEEIDELKKKAKEKKLDKQDQEKLERQLDKIKSELERLQRDKEKEEKKKEEEEKKDELKKEIEKKKEKGENAEQLERELEKMEKQQKQDAETEQQLKDLAEKLGRAQQAAKEGDLERLAEELEQAKGEFEKLEGQIEDFKETEQELQRLKGERQEASKAGGKKVAAQGQGEGEEGGNKQGPGGTGQGSGQRPINEDAKTGSVDEKVRGPFDPKGKKIYGGTTRGPSFTKKSETELGKEIEQAVQEAPAAADAQRLPRDARDAVKEYYEKLGGTGPKK
jgi:chemotaxis protein histidine kinase CheA